MVGKLDSRTQGLDTKLTALQNMEIGLRDLADEGIVLPSSESMSGNVREAKEVLEAQIVEAKKIIVEIDELNETLADKANLNDTTIEALEKTLNELTENLEDIFNGQSKTLSKETYGQITFKERSTEHVPSLAEPSRVIEGTYTVPRDATVKELLVEMLGEEDAKLLIKTSDERRESMIDWDQELKKGQEFKFINLLNSNNMERDTQEKYYGEVNAELANPLAHTLYRAELVSQIKKLDIDLSQNPDSLKEEVREKLGELAAEEIYQLRYGVSRDASGALNVHSDGRLYATGVFRLANDRSFGLWSPALESK